MNYEDMSDFEVNKLVAIELNLHDGEVGYFDRLPQLVPDYCNNPSDMMPIAFENKIDICHMVNGSITCAVFKPDDKGMYREFYTSINKNPLRSAAICFLKMKDAENER